MVFIMVGVVKGVFICFALMAVCYRYSAPVGVRARSRAPVCPCLCVCLCRVSYLSYRIVPYRIPCVLYMSVPSCLSDVSCAMSMSMCVVVPISPPESCTFISVLYHCVSAAHCQLLVALLVLVLGKWLFLWSYSPINTYECCTVTASRRRRGHSQLPPHVRSRSLLSSQLAEVTRPRDGRLPPRHSMWCNPRLSFYHSLCPCHYHSLFLALSLCCVCVVPGFRNVRGKREPRAVVGMNQEE